MPVGPKPKREITLLHKAAQEGNEQLIQQLLELKANPTVKTPLGSTPLHLAALLGHRKALATLLQANPNNIDEPDEKGRTPLFVASLGGHTNVVIALLKAKANANTRCTALERPSPLAVAIYNGKAATVEALLAAKATINENPNNKMPIIHEAIRQDHPTIVRLLLNAKANIGVTPNTPSALFLAAQLGHTRIVEMLLEAKADIESETREFCTPLFIAAQNGRAQTVSALLANKANIHIKLADGTGCSLLHIAAQNNHRDTVKLLLAAKLDINAPMHNGRTPLILAINGGHTGMVNLLIEAKASVNYHVDNTETTPLQLAARNGHAGIVTILLAAHAAIDSQAKMGQTALYSAAGGGFAATVDILLRAKAKPNLKTVQDETPLYIAAEKGHEAAVNLLLEAKANTEQHNKRNGATTLLVAIQYKHYKVIEALLRAGADPEAESTAGFSPLHIAAQNGDVTTITSLIAAKAQNIDPKTQKEKATPLHLAISTGHLSAVTLLLAANADPRVPIMGNSALNMALGQGHSRIAQAISAALNTPPKAKKAAPAPKVKEKKVEVKSQTVLQSFATKSLLQANADPNPSALTDFWRTNTSLSSATVRRISDIKPDAKAASESAVGRPLRT